MNISKTKNNDTKLVPIINWNRCESDEICVKACPSAVLEMNKISDEEYSNLSFGGKLKTRFHGKEKAMVANPDNCIGCGKCVKVCPENAIKLIKL